MRRRLAAALSGLGEGMQQIGMAGLQRSLQDTEPQLPMTGSGAKPPAQREAEVEGQQEDPYVLPARPSTLHRESDPMLNPAVQLARRRLSPQGFGRRRLG